MIQANELRIGNWFIGYDNKPFQFDYTDFMIIGTPAQWEQKPFEPDELIKSPIKLTEEILLKCGFTGSDDSIFSHPRIGSIYFKKPFRESEYYLVKSIGQDKITSVTFLHQLQNLYHDLTGQELEVKL